VRVFRLDEDVLVDVRYTLYARPFAAVLASSKYSMVAASQLIASGFVPGQHFTVMTKEEAAAFTGDTCVTFATESHFLASQEDNSAHNVSYPNSFVSAVRKFVTSGGNFLAQCGGLSTYEQCDNIKPDVILSVVTFTACQDYTSYALVGVQRSLLPSHEQYLGVP